MSEATTDIVETGNSGGAVATTEKTGWFRAAAVRQ